MKTTQFTKSKPEGEIGQLVLRAAEAQQRAGLARKRARLAKAQYKDARKAFKKAKRAAKEARKLAKAAAKALKVQAKEKTKPSRLQKPKSTSPPRRKGKTGRPLISTTAFSKTTSTVTTPTPVISDAANPAITPETGPGHGTH